VENALAGRTDTTVMTRVRYAETDMMGVAYNSNYLIWFELGRAAYMRERGIPYSEVEKRGYFLPISEFNCRIAAPASYDQELVIGARIKEVRSRSITFGYRIERDGAKLAEGETKHICVGGDRKPTSLPSWLVEKLKS
jgi:acyl-CoA thioester hydrolase